MFYDCVVFWNSWAQFLAYFRFPWASGTPQGCPGGAQGSPGGCRGVPGGTWGVRRAAWEVLGRSLGVPRGSLGGLGELLGSSWGALDEPLRSPRAPAGVHKAIFEISKKPLVFIVYLRYGHPQGVPRGCLEPPWNALGPSQGSQRTPQGNMRYNGRAHGTLVAP